MDVDSPNSLKRCSSAPHINNLIPAVATTQMSSNTQTTNSAPRDVQPTSFSNIFTPRVRRFSASFSPLAIQSNGSASPNRNGGPRLNRICQLRQEECADVNLREVNHEREVHSAMQMSQSYEDLTLVTENWSFSTNNNNNKNNEEPLHVQLPVSGSICCSSPSPTSRAGLKLPIHTLSPSPTRKTFATRRSMSPCAMRPSPLSSVKRKFDYDDNYTNSYSPPPIKKMMYMSDRSSPLSQTPSPSPICCPSPDSSIGSFDSGRITPKIFATKIFTQNSNGADSSSPSSAIMMDCGVSSSSDSTTNQSAVANDFDGNTAKVNLVVISSQPSTSVNIDLNTI